MSLYEDVSANWNRAREQGRRFHSDSKARSPHDYATSLAVRKNVLFRFDSCLRGCTDNNGGGAGKVIRRSLPQRAAKTVGAPCCSCWGQGTISAAFQSMGGKTCNNCNCWPGCCKGFHPSHSDKLSHSRVVYKVTATNCDIFTHRESRAAPERIRGGPRCPVVTQCHPRCSATRF